MGALGAVGLLLVAAMGVVFWLQRDVQDKAECGTSAAPGVNWSGCRLLALSAERADLRGVAFVQGAAPEARLRGADLASGDLRGADLRRTDLRYARLGGANLAGADLRGADLRHARFYDADLTGADLRDARLEHIDLRHARLDGALWVDGTRCANVAVGHCLGQPQTAVVSAGDGVGRSPTAIVADTDTNTGKSTL